MFDSYTGNKYHVEEVEPSPTNTSGSLWFTCDDGYHISEPAYDITSGNTEENIDSNGDRQAGAVVQTDTSISGQWQSLNNDILAYNNINRAASNSNVSGFGCIPNRLVVASST